MDITDTEVGYSFSFVYLRLETMELYPLEGDLITTHQTYSQQIDKQYVIHLWLLRSGVILM